MKVADADRNRRGVWRSLFVQHRGVTEVMLLNVPFLSSIYIGDGIWLPRTMARGGQSSVSKNRSSGSDVERSLLREWGWRGPAHLLYKRCRLFRPRRRDLGFGRASNCNEEVARRHRN